MCATHRGRWTLACYPNSANLMSRYAIESPRRVGVGIADTDPHLRVVPPAGLEPTTWRVEAADSIQLSYRGLVLWL